MRKILFTRPDGGCTVVIPVINTHEELTEADAEKRAWDKLPADSINPQWITDGDIPKDRSKRNQWKQVGASIVIDE